MTQPRKSARAPRPAATDPGDRRPLTARSVVASTLLGIDPPRLSTALLVRSGELFGISGPTTRVALSRMVAAGELEPDPPADGAGTGTGGQVAGYRLAGPMLARQARQAASRSAETAALEGRVGDGRGHRRPPVRLRSGRSPRRHEPPAPGRGARERVAATRQPRPGPGARGRGRGGRAVHPLLGPTRRRAPGRARRPSLAPRRVVFDDRPVCGPRWPTCSAPLESGDTAALAPGFVVSAAVLRHLLADPLLPAELLPAVLARRCPPHRVRPLRPRLQVGVARLAPPAAGDLNPAHPNWWPSRCGFRTAIATSSRGSVPPCRRGRSTNDWPSWV